MFEKVIAAIREYNRIIIHRHKNPDGDALGSQLGLCGILKANFPQKEILCVGDTSARYAFMGFTPDEVAALLDQWGYQLRERKMEKFEMDNLMLEDAVRCAVDMHQGQLRKGTQIPYIFHPLEVLGILREMKADANLQVAGVLHDTIEDTEATYGDILDRFGSDVADLVNAHSEDKSKSWEERKTHAIEHLAQGDRRLKMLVMADKVSNLRSMLYDYRRLGKGLWKRFNATKEDQAWYNSEIQDLMAEFREDEAVRIVYWELVALFKDLFVDYYLDEENHILYQICGTDSWKMIWGDSPWEPLDEPLPAGAVKLSRLKAERLEDIWRWEGRDFTMICSVILCLLTAS